MPLLLVLFRPLCLSAQTGCFFQCQRAASCLSCTFTSVQRCLFLPSVWVCTWWCRARGGTVSVQVTKIVTCRVSGCVHGGAGQRGHRNSTVNGMETCTCKFKTVCMVVQGKGRHRRLSRWQCMHTTWRLRHMLTPRPRCRRRCRPTPWLPKPRRMLMPRSAPPPPPCGPSPVLSSTPPRPSPCFAYWP